MSNHICCLRLKSLETRDIEGIWLILTDNSTSTVLGTVYRPPSNSNFFNNFYTVLEKVWTKYRNVVLVGDLNADITRSVNGEIVSTHGKKLLRTLELFNYSVMNYQLTRVAATSSTLIDHIISSKSEMKCLELAISDHMLVYASLTIKVKRPPPKIINARTTVSSTPTIFVRTLRKPFGLYVSFLTILMMFTGRGVLFLTTFPKDTHPADELRSDKIHCLGSLHKFAI